jgi:hypothetical protein
METKSFSPSSSFMTRKDNGFVERKEPYSMKPLAIAVASLMLLSAIGVGADASPAVAAYSHAEGNNTRTPGSKATQKAATRVPKDKGIPKNPKEKKVNFSGDVVAVGDGSLTMKTKAGEEISFLVTEDTAIKIPTLGKNATFADINVGVHALVRALEGKDGSLTALQISVVPGKPVEKHHVGVVTAYEPGASITIKAHDGNEYTFLITQDTKILPKDRADELAVGRRVTIISRRDPTGGPFTAQGIVVHPVTEDGSLTPLATPTDTPTATPTATPTVTLTGEGSPTETPTLT